MTCLHPAIATEPATTDTSRWAALLRRDATADGAFVYGIRTTGIYCRPSCPSRRPRRAQVGFTPRRAEPDRAGLRACRRCRPDDASRADRQAAAVIEACRTMGRSDANVPVARLAAAARMSPSHFHRVFRKITGVTVKGYADAQRAARAAAGLREAAASVTGTLYEAGYGSASRFYASARERLGMAPAAYRKGGAGVEISYAVGPCTLGFVLVAATAQGICAILLGDDPDALVRDLKDRFPHAQLAAGDAEFEGRVGAVIGLVDDPARTTVLPLDLGGTAFQQRVWQALRAIPPGATATYGEVARGLGEPRAVRAVARACGANPLAVAVPCHRVVRSDGSLSGYRWGVERKRELLRREREAVRREERDSEGP